MYYNTTQIYTLVGDVLLAVNPFRDVPIYTDKVKAQYYPQGPITMVRPCPVHMHALVMQN